MLGTGGEARKPADEARGSLGLFLPGLSRRPTTPGKKSISGTPLKSSTVFGKPLRDLGPSSVLFETEKMVNKVQKFIGKKLDTKAMEGCVDLSLYRNKVKEKQNS